MSKGTAPLTITLNEEWRALRARLSDPRHVITAGNAIVLDAAKEGEKASRAFLEPLGTHAAVRTIGSGLMHKPMTARVYSIMTPKRVLSMQAGRKPGTKIPFKAVTAWAIGKPWSIERAANLTKYERNKVFYAWNQIYRTGAKPVKFLDVARDAALKAVPGIVARVGATLVKRLAGR